jgi:hypothetical protein
MYYKRYGELAQYKQNLISKNENYGYIYVVKCRHYYKIGRTINVKRRWSGRGFRTDNPTGRCVLLMAHLTKNYKLQESYLHHSFDACRRNGEWFKLEEYQLLAIKTFLEQKELELFNIERYRDGNSQWFKYLLNKFNKKSDKSTFLYSGY